MTKEENKKRALEAIEFIKKAECESDVKDATAISNEVFWHEVPELHDEWNDFYGDAKKYLP